MRSATAALFALLLASAAGCAGPSAASLPATLPPDWGSGVPMLPYQTLSTHSGFRQVFLYPDGSMERPASCAAYRDGASSPRDTCEVRDARPGEGEAPWAVVAAWAGCPEGDFSTRSPRCDAPVPEYRPRAVAFDGAGRPAAWWDGADGPLTVHATE